MRSCIYCGKELKPGEVCDCPQSAARRKNNESTSNNRQAEYNNPYKTETSYKTGYAGKDNRFERAKARRNAKRAAKKTAARKRRGEKVEVKGFIRNLFGYIIDFLKSPTDKISNPSNLGKGSILTIAALQGAVLWLCIFFIVRGAAVGPFKLLASMMSFDGVAGYKLVLSVVMVILSGAVGGIVMFMLYSGIFYLINRFIMRSRTVFWDFCIRLISAWIPFTVICAIGAALSILSPLTLVILVLCGAVSVAVLTYEALKIEWISKSPGKVLYAMLLGYFIFFSIACHFLLI